MLTVALSLAIVLQDTPVLEVSGKDAGLRIVRSRGELHTEIFLIGDGNVKRVIAVSTSHPDLKLTQPRFQSFNGLGLIKAQQREYSVELTGDSYTVTIQVPTEGSIFNFSASAGSINSRDAVLGFALFPDKETSIATRTFSPAGTNSDLITYERFMTPAVAVSSRGTGIAIVADVSALELGAVVPPILHLDSRGDAAGTPIIGYGFASYKRDENWNAVRDDSQLLAHGPTSWSFDFIVSDEDVLELTAKRMWSKIGQQRSISPFPQSKPFRYYTKPAYNLRKAPIDNHVDESARTLWWTAEIDGNLVRAPHGILSQGRIDSDHNLARFAWGLKWWGNRLVQSSWERNAGEVMSLVLSAPAVGENMPVSFDFTTKSWQMEPTDLSSVAQTGRWMLKFAEEFEDYERNDELIARSTQISNVLLDDHPTGLGTLFLMEIERSSAIKDQPLKDAINSYLLEWSNDLRELARLLDRQGAGASAESVATALVLVDSGDAQSIAAGRQLLTRLFLNQALFAPPMYSGTPIFGAHVTDKILRQEQSVYTADLLKAAMLLGDRELVERAIASLRSPLALFNASGHVLSDMKFPANLVADRVYPWYGAKGLDERGDWQSHTNGTGQLLTSLAETLDNFGSVYTHKAGWTIGIDGIHAVEKGEYYSAFSLNRNAFAALFHYIHVDGMTGERTAGVDPVNFPIINNVKLTLVDRELYVAAIPGFVSTSARTTLSGSFSFGDGSTVQAEFIRTGFGAKTTAELLTRGPVKFNGLWKEDDISFPAERLLASPPSADAPYGWIRKNGLMDVLRSSVTLNNGLVISTADNGKGEKDQSLTGTIDSHPFLLTETVLKFTMYGSVDENAFIELVEAGTEASILNVKKVIDGSEDVSWDVLSHLGKSVVLRLVDESKTSSITIENLRTAKVGPN